MSGKLEGKVIIVTGGSTGIGYAAARRCVAEGAAVLIADINEAAGNQAAAELSANGGRAHFLLTDVTSAAAVEASVKTAVSRYGRLDGAFNNAGIDGGFTNTVKMTEEAFDRTIAVNLKGVWLCMRHELRVMAAQRSGVIVNTSSVAGLAGLRGCGAYAAAKHGVLGLTKTAALEYARFGIRVNAVCPGGIMTPMLEEAEARRTGVLDAMTSLEPLGRLGQPEEIASAVLWLSSPGASFTTGHAMAVDGGWMAQ